MFKSVNKVDLKWCDLQIIWMSDDKTKRVGTVTLKFSDRHDIRTVSLRFTHPYLYKINISQKRYNFQLDEKGKRVPYKELCLDTWLDFLNKMQGWQKKKLDVKELLKYLVFMGLGNILVSFDGFFNNYIDDFGVNLID